MSSDLQLSLGLPPADQVGFVVRDLEAAIRLYTPLFGEFRRMDALDMEWDYRGRRETSSLQLAMCQCGGIEIELIEWLSGLTPHKEFLDAGREGMHHIRFPVAALEPAVARAAELGYVSVWYKRFGPGLAAAYLERAGDPLVIELFENHPA